MEQSTSPKVLKKRKQPEGKTIVALELKVKKPKERKQMNINPSNVQQQPEMSQDQI